MISIGCGREEFPQYWGQRNRENSSSYIDDSQSTRENVICVYDPIGQKVSCVATLPQRGVMEYMIEELIIH